MDLTQDPKSLVSLDKHCSIFKKLFVHHSHLLLGPCNRALSPLLPAPDSTKSQDILCPFSSLYQHGLAPTPPLVPGPWCSPSSPGPGCLPGSLSNSLWVDVRQGILSRLSLGDLGALTIQRRFQLPLPHCDCQLSICP